MHSRIKLHLFSLLLLHKIPGSFMLFLENWTFLSQEGFFYDRFHSQKWDYSREPPILIAFLRLQRNSESQKEKRSDTLKEKESITNAVRSLIYKITWPLGDSFYLLILSQTTSQLRREIFHFRLDSSKAVQKTSKHHWEPYVLPENEQRIQILFRNIPHLVMIETEHADHLLEKEYRHWNYCSNPFLFCGFRILQPACLGYVPYYHWFSS